MMNSEDEVYTRLLSALLPSSPLSSSTSSTVRLQEATASLHAAALQSTGSLVQHLEFLVDTLSALPLPEPITFHATAHSANTQAILSYQKDVNPRILHVHAPSHKPIFPHHLHCTEAYLQLSSHTEAASLIASSLRDAVSAREPVTLIVVHLDATSSLLPALPVAHALADRFNGRVHATGTGCLSAFRDVPLAAHSVGMDIGGAIGVRGCGYITFGTQDVKDGYGDALLPFAVCLRYVLERFPLEKIKEVLDGTIGVVEGVGDALYRVEALWQVDILAEGEARISYNGEDPREVEKAVMLKDETGLLELSEGIFISATRALRRHRAPPKNAVRALCERLICVAREYELAKLARSAFVARLRQCEHVEARPGEGLVLSSLSVVPLGHVPPAGRWRTDEEARRIVEDCTERFAQSDFDEEVVVVMINGSENGARANVSPRIKGKIEAENKDLQMAEECERLAQDLLFDAITARSWGVRAADDVVQRIVRVVDEIGVADDGEVKEDIEDVQEIFEQEPDGTVEVIQTRDRSNAEDRSESVHAKVEKLNGGNDDSETVRSTDETSPIQDRKLEQLEHREPGAKKETDPRNKGTTQYGGTRPKSRPGLWGLIFGDNNAGTESEESSEDVDGKQLEDDYFRP